MSPYGITPASAGRPAAIITVPLNSLAPGRFEVIVRRQKMWQGLRVASGNFLEMYDFQIFGYYAAAIGGTFFPSRNEYASLMASLATFGAGFLMRPLGAIILGAYIDHHGRRSGLLLALGLMAAGTLSIALTPSYAA